MSFELTPPKLLLLAVQFAANADIDSLAFLVSRHHAVLHRDLILRVLLTYLPETLPSASYIPFLEELGGEFVERDNGTLDYSLVQDLSDEEAAKRVRKVRLLPLALEEQNAFFEDDPVTTFLLLRTYRIDSEAGMLTQVPELLSPFLQHNAKLRTWLLSTVLPLLRRNYEYYPYNGVPYTLSEFERLAPANAIGALLSRTGAEGDFDVVGRDLRGLVGPWLHGSGRWTSKSKSDLSTQNTTIAKATQDALICPGWEQVLEWLVVNAAKSWKVVAAVVEQWGGPEDVDLGDYNSWLEEDRQQYLDRRYARAVLASAYVIPETNVEALGGAYQIVTKVMDLLGEDDVPSLQSAAGSLLPVVTIDPSLTSSPKSTAWMRDDLLSDANPLTTPTSGATHLLHALVLSSFLLTRAGISCSIKQAGDWVFVQDEREQKAEALKFIHALPNRAHKNNDDYWTRARRELHWLRDWGVNSEAKVAGIGVFGQLKVEFLEAEFLKVLVSNSRLSLARSLYEEDTEPLAKSIVQDTVVTAALNAYDNASNPNRTRGGLKKCDEIITAFPGTIDESHPAKQRIEALLKATHALSDYRLVLKQGEPFSPVVLRAHSDPILVIGKLLEQNPKSYTRLHDLVEVGRNMVKAGLTSRKRKPTNSVALLPEEEQAQLASAEKRVTALCIEAALDEDDFETAYSYVMNRLTEVPAYSTATAELPLSGAKSNEGCSWRAALRAGQYIRNQQTVRPTHLGTASGNLDIRHLEQRIECLSTALRIAPPAQLQEILKTFRRCEEQLDSALKEEAELDAADEENLDHMPGGFGKPISRASSTRREGASYAIARSTITTSSAPSAKRTTTDDTPMSLFDLSRATARAASRNFTALSSLSSLHSNAGGVGGDDAKPKAVMTATQHGHGPDGYAGEDAWGDWSDDGADGKPRARKRDQLRDAAMGTLTSGVGWLIGAPGSTHPAPGS